MSWRLARASLVAASLSFVATSVAVAFDVAEPRSKLSGFWVNDGGDKVLQEETRLKTRGFNAVRNSVWNGSKIKLFAAKNEIVSFNLVLESADRLADKISVQFTKLAGPKGTTIESASTGVDGLFNWTNRNIELFYVRYLKIEGLSGFSYQSYDERHIPQGLRRPWKNAGEGMGTWKDRPNADKHYPEIAVPLELHPTFNIEKGQSQSIWADIYVPRYAEPGLYRGVISVFESGRRTIQVPVELTVRGFALPEVPSSKTMLYVGYEDLVQRYIGKNAVKFGTENEKKLRLIRDRHFQMAHRHKISVIDKDLGARGWGRDMPRYEWISRLDGTLFTPLNGYEGPGAYTGNGIYAIGAYGSWHWVKDDEEAVMHEHADAWVKWFKTHAPDTEIFLYLIDESSDFLETQKWAKWLKSNPGIGRELKSFATLSLPEALENVHDLDISASWLALGDKPVWEKAVSEAKADPSKKIFAYNGKRPGSGSFATEDDGVALRELPWGQYKHGIDRWFYWESTYYSDYQYGRGWNNLFHDAQTIGALNEKPDPVRGKSGYNFSNGDGVLFYPGTDTVYPEDSYNVAGPITSLRLKHWRRGIQDVDYLELARKIDPKRVDEIVARMVPKVLWENGIDNPADPTYVHCDISWSTNPDDWEAARAELADIIEGVKKTK